MRNYLLIFWTLVMNILLMIAWSDLDVDDLKLQVMHSHCKAMQWISQISVASEYNKWVMVLTNIFRKLHFVFLLLLAILTVSII